jgi:hypothetical protein
MLVCESHSSHLSSVCGSFLTPSMTFLSVFKIVSASLFMIPHVLIRAIVCLQCAILFFFFPFLFLYLSPAFISHHYTCPTYLVFLSLHRMFVILISPFMLAQTNMSVFFSHHYYHLVKSIFIHWNSLSLNNIYVQSFILQARFKMTFLGEQPFVVSEKQLPKERFDD